MIVCKVTIYFGICHGGKKTNGYAMDMRVAGYVFAAG